MQRFARLLDRLSLSPARNAKIRLLTEYFSVTPDPDRGFALAAITRDLEFKRAKPAMIRELVSRRCDPVLFELSYDYVGDLAETTALLWPARHGANRTPELTEVVEALTAIGAADNSKLVLMPLEASSVIGAIGGIAELAKSVNKAD